jgi:hypothetical protein
VGPNSGFGVPPPHIPALAEFEYVGTPSSAAPESPKFPNNITLKPLDKYVSKLRAYGESVTVLPKKVTQDLVYALGLGFVNCIPPEPCVFKIMAQIQNITFDLPKHTSILQA